MFVGEFEPVFGKNVRYLRGLCGLSQKSLATLVGTTSQCIRIIEEATGGISLDYRIMERLQEVFCVDIKNLTRVDFTAQQYLFPVYEDSAYPPVLHHNYDLSEKGLL